MNASVTVVSCVYGDRSYERFLSEWDHAIGRLDPRPDDVVVTSERDITLRHAHVFVQPACSWRHPQAFYLQQAVSIALTEWVWIVDIDDIALTNALSGLESVTEDVWHLGYIRTDGVTHWPPKLTGAQYLEQAGNHFAAGSMFRTAAFHAVGGFRDVAFQDWDLWRRMAANGATFKASDRPHYRYRIHDDSRTARELVPGRRWEFLTQIDMGDVVAIP